jgi:hypothetical protein
MTSIPPFTVFIDSALDQGFQFVDREGDVNRKSTPRFRPVEPSLAAKKIFAISELSGKTMTPIEIVGSVS